MSAASQDRPKSRDGLARTAAALAVLALAACGQGASTSTTPSAAATEPALPLTTGASPLPSAPPISALPRAPRPRIVRVASAEDAYAYVDQAAAMNGAFADAPPDYAFDDDGARPWTWIADDGSERLAEPVDGGWRYYYYRPGAAYPYYVQDPDYGYGYDGDALVIVYDRYRRPLPESAIAERAEFAGRYLARAEALVQASRRDPRRPVYAENWASRSPSFLAAAPSYRQDAAVDPAWRTYHQQHDADEAQFWRAERDRRLAAAAAFAGWRQAGYQGPPPPPAASSQTRGQGALGPFNRPASPAASRDVGPPAPTEATEGGRPAGRGASPEREGPAPPAGEPGARAGAPPLHRGFAGGAGETDRAGPAAPAASEAARQAALSRSADAHAEALAARAASQRQASLQAAAKAQGEAQVAARAQEETRARRSAQADAAARAQAAAEAGARSQAAARAAARQQADQAHAAQAAASQAARSQAAATAEAHAAQAHAAQAQAAQAHAAQVQAAARAAAAPHGPPPVAARPEPSHPDHPGERPSEDRGPH